MAPIHPSKLRGPDTILECTLICGDVVIYEFESNVCARSHSMVKMKRRCAEQMIIVVE